MENGVLRWLQEYYPMVYNNSLNELELIAAVLRDVHNAHGTVFNTTDLRNTINLVKRRYRAEGLSFLTKTLPKLGKAFDKAIAGGAPLHASDVGFNKKRIRETDWDAAGMPVSENLVEVELPNFLWEFTSRVLSSEGSILRDPCSSSVKVVRQVCYLFYKYKLPYTDEQEHAVVSAFEKTESDLKTTDARLEEIQDRVLVSYTPRPELPDKGDPALDITHEARRLLYRLFASFDPTDITPRHGPGMVATKQRLWGKFVWTNVSSQITDVYPFDAYFCASLGHVCDRWKGFGSITEKSLPAKVLLVPKDSRGPRLISCEPVDYQWIQQGLGTAIVKHVEGHYLTRENVRFTDQTPNRTVALLGSTDGAYSTLDLNEASDRVSLSLVRLLFPEKLCSYLEACRTASTTLPDGRVLPLRKFAPMGSCLCFPVLSLVVWSLLTAGANDTYTRERIYVYGDDVIVPTAYAMNAMNILESFGLKINRDKSCTGGLFRESCGMDAFKGVDVTPVRIRTVWSSVRSPSVYMSWIEYANSFYDRQCYTAYDYIAGLLYRTYGAIPGEEQVQKRAPSLRETPFGKQLRRRWNKNLQRFEYYCYGLRSPVLVKRLDGWSMLLRFFTEQAPPSIDPFTGRYQRATSRPFEEGRCRASEYTDRNSSMLERRWR
jgi:hypothetical protein